MTGFDGEGPTLPSTPHRARETRSMRRDRCTSLRQRYDRMPSGRQGGGCNGRRAVATDDRRRTTSSRHHAAATRSLRGAYGRPRAAIGSAECCIGAALLGTIWRGCRVALRTSTTTQIEDRIGTRVRAAASSEQTLRQRQCQQHEEHGRTFEWPTSATPGTGRRHAKFKFHWARIVRRMRARSRCCEWRA